MISAATVGAGGVIVLGTWQAITATTARAPATARWWESLSLNDIRVSTSAPPPFGGFALSTVRRVSGQSLAGPLPSSGDPGHGFVGQRSCGFLKRVKHSTFLESGPAPTPILRCRRRGAALHSSGSSPESGATDVEPADQNARKGDGRPALCAQPPSRGIDAAGARVPH